MPRENSARDTRLTIVQRVGRRLRAAHVLEGLSLGLAAGGVLAGLTRYAGWGLTSAAALAAALGAAVTVAWLFSRRAHRTSRAAAAAIEATLPARDNVVVTAEELTRHPDRARPWIRERVLADAQRMLAGVDPRAVVSLWLRMVLCVVGVAIAVGLVLNVHRRAVSVVLSTIEQAVAPSAARGFGVVAVLEPPPHTRLPRTTLSEPDRIAAVEGTLVRLTMSGGGPAVVRFGSVPLPSRGDGSATTAELTLRESGYLAIEGGPQPRLIPVAVTPDRAPAISVDRPGRDLLLPDRTRVVPVGATASDDFGLAEMALRYTKVSGSGEQFEFVEGELPLAIVRQDPRSWRGTGELSIARLGLEPGDSLVYRVVARDARAGEAGFAASDTYFIELAGPGQVALEGFEMPPERERNALSQQMIVLKIERVRARERTMTPEALREETSAIAAEQRAVRANFVFLMGGHVEDEEEEAERSTDIQEGRLENTARRDISSAITSMSGAERELVTPDTAAALKHARLAVEALQRAFGRNRYFLRTLPVRSRVDPSRRLTGKLDEAAGWRRTLPQPSRDRRLQTIRDMLAELMGSSGLGGSGLGGSGLGDQGAREQPSLERNDAASLVARLTEQALAIDPASPEWQQISTRLAALRDALGSAAPRETVDRALREALDPLVVQARKLARPRTLDSRGGPLRGAWADESRHARQR